jgi:hypothetical protein
MLMLTILHICLVANGRTLSLRAQAIKGKLKLPWVASCICTSLARSLRVVELARLPPVESIMVFLPM